MTDRLTRTGPLPASPAYAAAEGYAARIEGDGGTVTTAELAAVAATLAAIDSRRGILGIPARVVYAAAADWLADIRQLTSDGTLNGSVLFRPDTAAGALQAHGLADHEFGAELVLGVGWWALGAAAASDRVPGLALTPWALTNPNHQSEAAVMLMLAEDLCRTTLMDLPEAQATDVLDGRHADAGAAEHGAGDQA